MCDYWLIDDQGFRTRQCGRDGHPVGEVDGYSVGEDCFCWQHKPPKWAIDNIQAYNAWVCENMYRAKHLIVKLEFELFQQEVKEKAGLVYVTREERAQRKEREMMEAVHGLVNPPSLKLVPPTDPDPS